MGQLKQEVVKWELQQIEAAQGVQGEASSPEETPEQAEPLLSGGSS